MADLNTAVEKLIRWITDLDVEDQPPESLTAEPSLILSRDDATIFLNTEDADNYAQLVQEIFSAVEGRETLSRNAVERLVGDVLLRLAISKKQGSDTFLADVQEAIRRLRLELLAKPAEWEFYIPVVGFAPSELPYTVGPVEFYFADESGAQEFWSRASDVVPEYKGQQPNEILAADLRLQFANNCIARIRVMAIDWEAANNRALKMIRRVLDCVNFYADRTLGTGLHIAGDVGRGERLHLSLQMTGQLRATGRKVRLRPWRGMPIRQIAGRPGFARMSELLANTAPTDLEDRILTALQWAGRARVDPRSEESFLLYAVALETLLLGDSRDPVDLQHKLKLRCVHLVTAADLESRKLTFKQIGQLYATRSKIVHTGRVEVTDSESYLMDEYARVALFIVLDREPFKSMKLESDFDGWFDAQVLGRPGA